MRYWLFKTEPEDFGFVDLLASPDRQTAWEGVRNYQARNFMRDAMTPGDPAFVYHSSSRSSSREPAIVGLAEVASASYPDPSQFDPESPYHDAKATPDAPRWFLVDLRALRPLERPVTLAALRADAALQGMKLLQRGSRLSVLPLTEAEFERVLRLAAG